MNIESKNSSGLSNVGEDQYPSSNKNTSNLGGCLAPIIVIFSIVPLLGVLICPCMITKSIPTLGIQTLWPCDLKEAKLVNNAVLFLETDTLVHTGSNSFFKQSNERLKMRCDLNDSLNSLSDVTNEARKRSYNRIPGDLPHKHFNKISETDRIYYAKEAGCELEKNDTILSGQKLQLVSDDILAKSIVPKKTFFYMQGSFERHPMSKYLVFYQDEKTCIIIPIDFNDKGRRIEIKRETSERKLRYVLYPFAYVLDIFTYPIQIIMNVLDIEVF